MAAHFVTIASDDSKAIRHLTETLEICSPNHTLSRKVMSRFAPTDGVFVAVAPIWIDLSKLEQYRYGWMPPPSDETSVWPLDLLADLVAKFLGSTPNSIFVWEDPAAVWSNLSPELVWESKFVWFREEVYHIVIGSDATLPLIEATIREAEHFWSIGVCSSCSEPPKGAINDEQFFDELVANIKHVFMPAFDGNGYLIWSPKNSSAPAQR